MKKNIIHSVQVEINTTSLVTANAIRGSIDDVIKNEIFPRIERILEQYQSNLGVDESLQIDELKLDLTIEKSKLNSVEMVSELAEQFERSLINLQNQKSQALPKTSTEYLIDVQHPLFSTRSFSLHEKNLESFFFFIRTGTKPWWIVKGADLDKLLSSEQLSEIIAGNKTVFAQRFQSEIQRESSRKRIITQFSDEILIHLIHQSFSVTVGTKMNAQNLMKISQITGSNEHLRSVVWEFMMLQLTELSTGTSSIELKPLIEKVLIEISKKGVVFNTTNVSSESLIKNMVEPIVQILFTMHNKQTELSAQIQTQIRTLLDEITQRTEFQISTQISKKPSKKGEQIVTSEVLKPTDKTELKKPENDNPKVKKAIIIPPEGLHFDHAGLILLYPFLGHFFKHIELIDTNQNLKDPELAAHILHYIATGKENDWEFELVFEKYLAGIPIEEPISKNRVITDSVKDEINSMLEAVKNNWKPLMNSSNELLRYEFLQRPGKLVVEGQHHRIVMEKKTQDILLNQLTWTISIVRFPWRDELLYVEW